MQENRTEVNSSFFHSNVLTYVLIKRNLNGSLHVSLLCANQLNENGVAQEGIVAFINPIDAYIEALYLNRYQNEWEVYPFHQVDPREFIVTHDYKLRVYLLYAMAGYNGNVVSRSDTKAKFPKPLLQSYEFDISIDIAKKRMFYNYL